MLLNLQQTYGNTWRILTTDLYSLIKQLTAVNIWDLQLTGEINKWLPLVLNKFSSSFLRRLSSQT